MPRLSQMFLSAAIFTSCASVVVATPTPPTASAPSASATPIPQTTSTPALQPTAPATIAPTPSPTASSATTAPSGPASYCAVADVLTPNVTFDGHARTYLDWTYRLSETYIPPDLVNASNGAKLTITPFALEAVGAAEVLARRGDPSYSTLLTDAPGAAVRGLAYPDLVAMRAASLAAGHMLVILSAYRSYNLQVQTFDYWTQVGGYQQALRTSARPGHSEHQLGTAIDFGDGSAAPWEYTDWATTSTGAWLGAHAVEFGFVLSFPRAKTDVTCYDYEPWHYRFVGKALAQSLSESRVTLREYQSSTLR